MFFNLSSQLQVLTYTKSEVYANTSVAAPGYVKTDLLYINKSVNICQICIMFLCVQLCLPIKNSPLIPINNDFFFSYYNILHKSDSFKKCMKLLKDDMEMLIG